MNLNFPIELFRNLDKPTSLEIDIGLDIAQSSRIKFVGLAQNAAPWINRNIELCKHIGHMFADYDIYIYENDSTDDTVLIMQDHNIDFDSETRPDLKYTRSNDHYDRCVKLAEARNEYAKLDYSEYDYVCVIDWDIKGGWWIDGFFHAITSLEYMPNAAAVGSYGMLGETTGRKLLEECDRLEQYMYDCFAFRCMDSEEDVDMKTASLYNYMQTMIGMDPVKVKSVFGGITIYKREAFEGRTYSAREEKKGCVDCDHVCLHRDMRNDGYDIYIDPSFIASHSPHRYCYDEYYWSS